MLPVTQVGVPADSLLKTFRGGRHPQLWGAYSDCFSVSVAGTVTLAEFVVAFYTTRLFKAERVILQLLAGAPSSDAQAAALAEGSLDVFAAWVVGERSTTQLLMCDRYGRTRSWFQVVPGNAGGHVQTLLQFGSAVAARRKAGGATLLGVGFGGLLGFHRLYSRLLLRAAAVKLSADR